MQFVRNVLTGMRNTAICTRLFSTKQVAWPSFQSAEDWFDVLEAQNIPEQLKANLENDGWAVLEDVVPQDEGLGIYQKAVSQMHSGEINTSSWRHDLGSHKDQKDGVENTAQIMWPQDRLPGLGDGPFHERCALFAEYLYGDDMAFDFDMLIYKDPKTYTETPWHQDAAYWPEGMTDTRAITFWMALDDVYVDNGCMWFVSQTHLEKELRKHRPVTPTSHILMTDDVSKDEKKHAVPLIKGSAVFWSGRTLHFAGGNKTDTLRRTYIANYRPQSMVDFERNQGFDHGRGGLDNIDTIGLDNVSDEKGKKVTKSTV